MTGLFLSLLRKDPALKGTLTGLPLAIGFGLLFRWGAGDSMASLAGPDWPGIALFLFTVVWGFALWFLAFTGFWTRGHRLYVSLPISGRTLWFTRMTAVVLSIFLPACGFLLAIAFRTAGGGALTALGLKMVGALLLLVMIGQNPYPKLRVVPVQAPYLVFMVFLGILTLFYLRLTPSSILFVLLPFAGSVAVGVQTWLQIPAGFLLAPDRPGLSDGSPWWNGLEPVGEMEPAAETEENESAESTETSEATEVEDRSGAIATEEPSEPEATFRQVLHRTLYRALLHRFGVWMILLGLLFISYIQTWELFSGPGNWLMLIYVAGWVVGYFYRSRSWIRSLDPLPISRKRIFLYVAGALPIPILIGALLASLFTAAGHASLVTLKDRREVQLEIPYEFWRFAEAGEQPKATAPWGESLELPTYRIGPWTPRSPVQPVCRGQNKLPPLRGMADKQGGTRDQRREQLPVVPGPYPCLASRTARQRPVASGFAGLGVPQEPERAAALPGPIQPPRLGDPGHPGHRLDDPGTGPGSHHLAGFGGVSPCSVPDGSGKDPGLQHMAGLAALPPGPGRLLPASVSVHEGRTGPNPRQNTLAVFSFLTLIEQSFASENVSECARLGRTQPSASAAYPIVWEH